MGAQHNFVDHCLALAAERPNRTAFTWLNNGEEESHRLTFAELNRESRIIAGALQARGLAGKRALLIYPPGLEFITAFLGCLYAGVVAVPMNTPRNERAAQALQGIARHAAAAVLLTSRKNLENRWLHLDAMGELPVIATDLLEADPKQEWENRGTSPDQQAFLQYTSGSTGSPKGVQVSHRNLFANEAMIGSSFATGQDTVFISWLPVFHDMGLIGNVLHPLWLGVHSVLMAPSAFVQKPVRWLRAITRYSGTTTGGPNFGYDLCVRRVSEEQLEGLDLSCLKIAYNGSEPVRAHTLEQFAEKFSSVGFKRSAFLPCYGMAEASLFISGGDEGQPVKVLDVDRAALQDHRVQPARSTDARSERARLVGCGRAWHSQEILIVDPETATPLADDRVGEIWVRGANVSIGYRDLARDQANPFDAHLADGEGPFLRTGDLGFLRNGELFVTGRIKDVIILAGRNYYPQDIENVAGRSHPALRPEFSIAFTIEDDDQERVVVVQEVHRHHSKPLLKLGPEGRAFRTELTGAIRAAVSSTYDIRVSEVHFVRHASIPRTSSGKVQRRKCRALLKAGELHELLPPTTETTVR